MTYAYKMALEDIFPVSEESIIDRRLEELAGKIVAGTATAEDIEEYKSLHAGRVRRMHSYEKVSIGRVRSVLGR